MELKQLSIAGYRGFRERRHIDFAVPKDDMPGSGLTMITGPNNSGKSSILECLRYRSSYEMPSFSMTARNSHTDEVIIKYTINDSTETIRSIQRGSSETIAEPTQNANSADPASFYVLPSRRGFNPYFSVRKYRGEHDLEQARDNYLKNSARETTRTNTLPQFETRLSRIVATQEDKDAFDMILERVLGSRSEWSLDLTGQGQHFLKFTNAQAASHSSEGMGEGIVSIFAIVDSLYDSKPGSVIAIDEPELSLHPTLQRRLSDLIVEYSKDRQIILSTHSPYFVSLNALEAGGQLARVTSSASGTTIFQLSSEGRRSIRKLTTFNPYNPHVFGLDAKELFFHNDGIILTEGQDDVIFYPKIAAELGIDIPGSFFGWGAGGASNIRHLAVVLRDLGYRRVAGLLDGDKMEDRNRLAADFPEFHFACIPADDIRTKVQVNQEVRGLLDEKHHLRPEYRTSMVSFFDSLIGYMTDRSERPTAACATGGSSSQQ